MISGRMPSTWLAPCPLRTAGPPLGGPKMFTLLSMRTVSVSSQVPAQRWIVSPSLAASIACCRSAVGGRQGPCTQRPPCPGTLHVPSQHTSPLWQILPQPPQLALSIFTSVQPDPQQVRRAGHGAADLPFGKRVLQQTLASAIWAAEMFVPRRSAPQSWAPLKSVPPVVAPRRLALRRVAPAKQASPRLAPLRLTPSMWAPAKFAPLALAPWRFAPTRPASAKSHSRRLWPGLASRALQARAPEPEQTEPVGRGASPPGLPCWCSCLRFRLRLRAVAVSSARPAATASRPSAPRRVVPAPSDCVIASKRFPSTHASQANALSCRGQRDHDSNPALETLPYLLEPTPHRGVGDATICSQPPS